MTRGMEEIVEIFKIFVEGTLIEHNIEKSLSVIADDVIGIGMGNQGIVTGKMDLIRILNNGKGKEEAMTMVSYDRIQIRCYEERFGSICGILKIKTITDGEIVESSLGQMMSVRKEEGRWWIYAIQATPLFNEIEEMEAYPLKFAENALEQYRIQEQIAKDIQKGSVGIYRINLTKGIFEDCILKNDVVIPTQVGEKYEEIIFKSARRHLKEEECHQFISTFSIGNMIKTYNSGQTELSMEYEMVLSKKKSLWMKTVSRLYMDKTDGNLKGYLYVFDIDEEKRKELELWNRLERDPMTEVYNKKYSELKIQQKLKQILPTSQGVFFMIDLDRFKNINDTYGHKEGDRVIKETVQCIRKLIRKNDIIGRLGGDEFCVYFEGELTFETILEKAASICKGVREIIPSKEAGTSCSIGIVFCTNSEMTFEEIYQKADQALYQQKENGRNGYTIFKEEKVDEKAE